MSHSITTKVVGILHEIELIQERIEILEKSEIVLQQKEKNKGKDSHLNEWFDNEETSAIKDIILEQLKQKWTTSKDEVVELVMWLEEENERIKSRVIGFGYSYRSDYICKR